VDEDVSDDEKLDATDAFFDDLNANDIWPLAIIAKQGIVSLSKSCPMELAG